MEINKSFFHWHGLQCGDRSETLLLINTYWSLIKPDIIRMNLQNYF